MCYLEHTKFEITKFVSTTYLLSFLGSDDGTSHHHRAHTNDHNPAKLFRINRHNNTNILTIHVQPEINSYSERFIRRANRHWIDCRVLSLNRPRLSQYDIHRDMKTMIILRCQSKYS